MGRTAVYLESLPLSQLTQFAQKADERGFDSIWKPEIIFSDAFGPLYRLCISKKEEEKATRARHPSPSH